MENFQHFANVSLTNRIIMHAHHTDWILTGNEFAILDLFLILQTLNHSLFLIYCFKHYNLFTFLNEQKKKLRLKNITICFHKNKLPTGIELQTLKPCRQFEFQLKHLLIVVRGSVLKSKA